MKKFSIILLLTILGRSALFAQSGAMAVGSFTDASGRPYLGLKWIRSGYINPEGAHVYRRIAGTTQWQQLTNEPVRTGPEPTAADYRQDDQLASYVDMARQLAKNEAARQNGLVGLTLGTQAMLSEAFAAFIGIRYDDRTVQPGTAYDYKVVDTQDNLIAQQTAVQWQENIAVAPPDDMQVVQQKKKVQISYAPEPLRYFAVNVYRATGNADFQRMNERPILFIAQRDENGKQYFPDYFYEDDSVATGQTYRYQLRAIDFFGREGEPSAVRDLYVKDPTQPRPPYDLAARHEAGVINLEWQSEESGLKGFRILKSNSPDGEYRVVTDELLPATVRSYQVSDPEPGVWYYRVQAVNFVDNTSESELSVVAIRDAFPPEMPLGLVAEAEAGQVTLRWQPNGEADLAGYHLYQSIDGGSNYERINAEVINDTRFVHTLPTVTKNEIQFKIVATDRSGNKSPDSETVSSRLPDATPPPAPFIKQAVAEEDVIRLEWLPFARQTWGATTCTDAPRVAHGSRSTSTNFQRPRRATKTVRPCLAWPTNTRCTRWMPRATARKPRTPTQFGGPKRPRRLRPSRSLMRRLSARKKTYGCAGNWLSLTVSKE